MLSSIAHRKTEETHVKTGKLKYIHVLAYFSNFCFITVTQNSKFTSPVALQVCLTLAIRQTLQTFLVWPLSVPHTLFFFFLFLYSLQLGLIQHQGHKEDVLAIVEGSQNSIGCGHHVRTEQRLQTVQNNSLLTVTQLKNRSVYHYDYNRTRIPLS